VTLKTDSGEEIAVAMTAEAKKLALAQREAKAAAAEGSGMPSSPKFALDNSVSSFSLQPMFAAKKGRRKVQLRITEMALQVLSSGSVVESYLYQDMVQWDPADGYFSLVTTKSDKSIIFRMHGVSDADLLADEIMKKAEALSKGRPASNDTFDVALGSQCGSDEEDQYVSVSVGVPLVYRALKKGVVRAEFERDSSKVGDLKMDEEIIVLEERENEDGQLRIRFDRGWVSKTAASGNALLELVEHADATSDQNEIPGGKPKQRRQSLTELQKAYEDKISQAVGSATDTNRKRRGEVSGRAAISGRPFVPNEMFELKVIPKTTEESKQLLLSLQSLDLFEHLDDSQLQEMVSCMSRENVSAGEHVITQGDIGNTFYVIQKGDFDCLVATGDKEPKVVASLTRGDCFGELALLYGEPRAATVTATTPSIVWTIGIDQFKHVVVFGNESKRKQIESVLEQVPILQGMTKAKRVSMAEAMNVQTFGIGDDIIKQGDKGESFYILQVGEALVTITGVGQVATKFAGDFFGETALQDNQPRSATVSAVKPCICLELGRVDFESLIGRLDGLAEDDDESMTATLVDDLSGADNEMAFDGVELKLADFETGVMLGRGSFGRVMHAKHAASGGYYALKCMAKQALLEMGQLEHVISEKKVLQAIHHPGLVNMEGFFQDEKYLYMLLEYVVGGELYFVMAQQEEGTGFDNESARFYIGQIIAAMGYMHAKNIIYRDLKPENLLIDSDGYLKITDFGFAKFLAPGDRTWTVCGTPEYIAPEIITNAGHSKPADWWSVGVSLFELLAGRTPFETRGGGMATYKLIMKAEYTMPDTFDMDAKDLIREMLTVDPTKRLGCLAAGAQDLRDHKWFRKSNMFEWQALEARTLNAPWNPPAKSKSDTSNFIDTSNDEEEPLDDRPPAAEDQLKFANF
jgi:cGMP-dependent protein kinase